LEVQNLIYLSDGNISLNAAYDDNITQEANSTYQLTFKFPTNNILWQRLREETFLTADDLHGEQDFVIFEVEKHHGYIQVYANQVMTLLNNYVIGSLALDRVSGSTALSQFAGSITRENPFSFFSDIDDRHTFNTDSINAMAALTKDKHSILGQWGGDLVRHGYQVRLLKNGGSENESLFMYKKNLSSYKQKTSTKSLKTRITFKKTIKSSSENNDEHKIAVVVDSPLINKYSQIYEDVVEVNDQDVKDEASLREYGKQYFRTTLCDMLEDSIEIDVIGQSDVPVQIFDVVGVYYEYYDLDVRKKITKYNYSPMAKKLKSIGFGEFKSGLANAIGNAVSDAVKNEIQHLDGIFEAKLAKEIQNADLAFDRKVEEIKNQFEDEVNAAKAKAEENKRALSDEIDRRFHEFSPTGFEEAKAKAEEALRKAGTSAELVEQIKEITELRNKNFERFKEEANQKFVVSDELHFFLSKKADQTDFQRVKETAQLYERIFGNTQNGVADNISRMVMTNQIFQTEVKKYVENNSNLVFDPTNFSKWGKKQAEANVIEVQAGTKLLRITNTGKTQAVYHGFALPLTTSTFRQGEKLSYRMQVWVDALPDAPLGIELWSSDGGLASDSVTFTKTGVQYITGTMTVQKSSTKGREFPLEIWLMKNGQVAIGQVSLIRGETPPQDFKDDTSTQDLVTQTKVSQLFDSYAIQTLTNAGAIASQINLNSNNILIEAAKIRLKGRTLLDEITAIDGYFKRLFVGDARIGTLNTDIIRSNSIAADKLIFDTALAKKLVASDVFTDTLAAKTAFINKLRSVVVSATLLEGYKGKIGGFQIGTHDKDSTTFWLTGSNSFRVGMSDGGWRVNQTCLWVNWGNDWGKPGDNAWYVTNSGEMNCRGAANFYKKVDFSASSSVNFYGRNTFYADLHMTNKEIYGDGGNPKGGKNAVVWWNQVGSGSLKYHIDRSSDRRLKKNIFDSNVNALDLINQLRMKRFDFIDTGIHEEVGLIAQEVEKILPTVVSRNPENEDDYLHIDYTAFVPYLIKAIQELNQKVERFETT
jgi:phage minor structural protein, N-terminal domain protein